MSKKEMSTAQREANQARPAANKRRRMAAHEKRMANHRAKLDGRKNAPAKKQGKAAIIVPVWLTTIRQAFEDITANRISVDAIGTGLAAKVLHHLQGKAGEFKVPDWNAHLSFKTAQKLNAPVWDKEWARMPYDVMVNA